MIVGIVAEGPTDVVILEEYLSERLKSGGVSVPLEIRPLQPAVDATSGTFEDGGWTWVKTWCRNNPPEHRAVDLFQPLFEGDRPLDVLLVQVDGDVVDEYAKPYPHIPVPMNPDASTRGQIVEAILEEWLWGGSQRRGHDPDASKHCLVATVRTSETWIVAGMDRSIQNPEELDPEVELMRIAPPGLRIRTRRGRRRLVKKPDVWRMLVQQTLEQLPHIASVCPHCEKFLQCVEVLAKGHR